MARHRGYSIEFKRQVPQKFLGGESLNGMARRHDLSRNFIRVWVAKYEAGAFDDEFQAADLLRGFCQRIWRWSQTRHERTAHRIRMGHCGPDRRVAARAASSWVSIMGTRFLHDQGILRRSTRA